MLKAMNSNAAEAAMPVPDLATSKVTGVLKDRAKNSLAMPDRAKASSLVTDLADL
jgi:hypothetical protein